MPTSIGWSRRASLRVSVAALLAGCATVDRPPRATGRADRILSIVGRGWHTDVGFAAADLAGPLSAAMDAVFPGVAWLVFGFGDRGYLLSPRRPGDALDALWPGPGAILVTALRVTPREAFGADRVVEIDLPAASLSAAAAFVQGSFEWAGGPRAVKEGPYPGSRFFAGSGAYAGTYTCNTWTADAMAAAGLPVSATGVLFAGQVMAAAHQAADWRR